MKKVGLIVIILILVISVISLGSYFFFSGAIERTDNLYTELSDCNEDLTRYTKRDADVVFKNWTSNDSIDVFTYVKMGCEYSTTIGSYKLNQSHLTLIYRVEENFNDGNCICARFMNYRLSKLNQNNISVSIIKK